MKKAHRVGDEHRWTYMCNVLYYHLFRTMLLPLAAVHAHTQPHLKFGWSIFKQTHDLKGREKHGKLQWFGDIVQQMTKTSPHNTKEMHFLDFVTMSLNIYHDQKWSCVWGLRAEPTAW